MDSHEYKSHSRDLFTGTRRAHSDTVELCAVPGGRRSSSQHLGIGGFSPYLTRDAAGPAGRNERLSSRKARQVGRLYHHATATAERRFSRHVSFARRVVARNALRRARGASAGPAVRARNHGYVRTLVLAAEMVL